MSTKSIETRDYRITDATLKQEADKVANNVERDAAEFLARGVDSEALAGFREQSENFGNLPTDEELVSQVSEAALNKDTKAEDLRVALRSIRTVAENTWLPTHPTFKGFVFEKINHVDDDQLVRSGKRILRKATLKLSEMTPQGLTAAQLTSANLKLTAFDTAVDVLEDAINERDISTQNRVVEGNSLYRGMIRLCNTGKDIWKSVDEAKYNDYVIYDTAPAGDPNTGVLFRALDSVGNYPLGNVEVFLKRKGLTEMTKSVKRTGTDGMARIPGLEVVEYEYELRAGIYVTATGEFAVIAGEFTEVTVMMVKS